MKLVFIHGAGATPDSFNYIEPKLNKKFKRSYITYDCADGFINNLDRMVCSLSTQNEDLFLISHSLGGVYSVLLEERLNGLVKGGVSIATPFDGCESAQLLNMLRPCQLYRDIGKYSIPILTSRRVVLSAPWCQIVTTAGNTHWIHQPNDGVVTIKSMTCRSDVEYVRLNSSHHEIMLNPMVPEVINKCISRIRAQ
jgi:pimeloyl-ACP methyl ester carboxylesterase